MAIVKIQYTGGKTTSLEVDADEWTKALNHALRRKGIIEILDSEERVFLVINPRQISYCLLQKSS